MRHTNGTPRTPKPEGRTAAESAGKKGRAMPSASASPAPVQRLRLTLQHPKRSVQQPWEVDTEGEGWIYLRGWIEAAAQTNREELHRLIVALHTNGTTPRDRMLLKYAREVYVEPIPSLIKTDELGHTAANIGPGLVDAHRVDYAGSKSYLAEGEGTLLAAQWGVDAEIFDRPEAGKKLIRAIIRYGESNPHHGYLLFVNGNHYVVITPAPGEDHDFIDLRGRKFLRSDKVTVADGNCLIDGLFILRHNRKATKEDFQAARRTLSSRLPEETIVNILTSHIDDVLHGIEPAQLGPEVQTMLDGDPRLMSRFRAAVSKRAADKEKEKPKPKSESSDKGPKAGVSAAKDGPALGLPGIAYVGPTKSEEEDSEAIHRGEAEIEFHDSVPYVRMYTAVPQPSVMKSVNLDTGMGTSDFKDIQQDVKTGKVIISPGANSMLWVSGGRILRQMKWAEKYIAEHKEKARLARAAVEAANLEIIRLTAANHAATPPELDAILLPQRTIVAEQQGKADFHGSITKPIIRSFLIPMDTFNDISKRAISENLIKKAGNEDKTFNVDRHAEPNQFGIRGKDLDLLGATARPQSLVSYAYDPVDAAKSPNHGEIQDAAGLRGRMGIPTTELPGYSVWVEGDGFIDRKNLKPKAQELNMYYATWLQSKAVDKAAPHPLLSEDKAKIPYKVRKEELDAFLLKNGKKEAGDIEAFMKDIVAPWATQAAIEQTMGEDYDRINKDENVKSVDKSTFKTNEFGANVAGSKAQLDKSRQTGDELDRRFAAKESPKQMIDYLTRQMPGLEPLFAKISAKSENYSFYEHAQMVLGQYMQIAQSDEGRLISRAAMAKMILFHDMEKTNSKTQYGKDPEGEHRLTVDVMTNHRHLWKDDQEFAAVTSIVSGDPIGEYMKGKMTEDRAFMAIVNLARGAGIAQKDFRKYFTEFHQFYQADFSSYMARSVYQDKSGAVKKGKPGFESYFAGGDTGALATVEREERLRYSARDNYEGKFAALQAMFASDEVIAGHVLRLDKKPGVLSKDDVVVGRRAKASGAEKLRALQAELSQTLRKVLGLPDKEDLTSLTMMGAVGYAEIKKAMGVGFDEQMLGIVNGAGTVKEARAEKLIAILNKRK